jgi:nucleotide-binding universal stress UspA family protein
MKRILVALDGSKVAEEVLSEAIVVGRATGAELILLRAVGLPIEMPAEAWAHPEEELSRMLLRGAEVDLGRFGEAVPKEIRWRKQAELGTPWQAICAAARKDDVDLIVIGSHGFGVLDRLLGTTAARVVNHADRNVLVVRPKALRQPQS